VPSDREVPRALNEAVPIVSAKRGSGVAKALNRLAQIHVARLPARTNGAEDAEVAGSRPARRFLARKS